MLQLETSSAEQFGICVEMCSINPEDPNGFGACADGYICKFNGCGHTCQLGESSACVESKLCVSKYRNEPYFHRMMNYVSQNLVMNLIITD